MSEVRIKNTRRSSRVMVMGYVLRPQQSFRAEREAYLAWRNESSGNAKEADEYLEVTAVAEGDAPETERPGMALDRTQSGTIILSTNPAETPSGVAGSEPPSPSDTGSPDPSGGAPGAATSPEATTDGQEQPKTRRRRQRQVKPQAEE